MIINAINLKTKNNPNIFIVQTDDGEFVLHSDVIVKYGLTTGVVDDKIFNKACEDSKVIIATNLTVKYLNSRLKTERQIHDYLKKKNFDSNTINEVIKKLKEYKLIDDDEYAKIFIRSNTGNSKLKLKQKLIAAGIDKNYIDDELKDFDDYDSCLNSAKRFLKSKEINKSNIEKLTRRLSYQGYKWDTIKKVLNSLTNADFDDMSF